MNSPTQFVKYVEAHLGWAPPSGPEWKRYQGEAHKVSAKRAANPELYSWENLQLAVSLLRKERKPRSPIGVFAHVERALALRVDHEMDIEIEIREVVAQEMDRGNPDGWVERLTRAEGIYRQHALAEWKTQVPA